tara:strand:- start:6932 stop:7846 length:915 start_codon:yes stop_codon:yes gene_type:complete
MVRIKNIDLMNINEKTKEDIQYLFKTTPVLVFENQKITPEDQFFICTMFDSNYTTKIMHPFKETAIPDIKQVALRGKGTANLFNLKHVPIRNSRAFQYTPLWHQDLVGTKDVLPPVVSSMYMIKTPKHGGTTSFASLEAAYESMSVEDRKICNNINCLYSSYHGLSAEVDHTGYGRIDKYWEKEINNEIMKNMVSQPLVIYPTSEDTKRTLMLSPNKLYKFEGNNNGVSPSYSQEKIRYVMKNYVLSLNNIGTIKYREKDLVIFNNRKVMHTSSPTQEYDEERYFSLLFLGTKSPFYNSSLTFH